MCMSLFPFLHILIRLLRFDRRDEWAKFTNYRGYEVYDEVIQWFWKCVRSWSSEQKSRLLRFATGTTRIRVDGIKDLRGSDGLQRFTIEKAGDPDELPKGHSSLNRIDLPPYKDYPTLEHKLSVAVERASLYKKDTGDEYVYPVEKSFPLDTKE